MIKCSMQLSSWKVCYRLVRLLRFFRAQQPPACINNSIVARCTLHAARCTLHAAGIDESVNASLLGV